MVQFMRLGELGHERPAVQADDVIYDLTPLTNDIDGAFLVGDGIARTREALGAGRLPRLATAGLRIGAPVARPSSILCIGQNYAAHAAESGSPPPAAPILFFKATNSLVGPYDDVLIPRRSAKTDWEVELSVIIGRRARYLESPDEALAYVAGYTIANDVSERTFQIEVSGGQWSKGKSAETFNPLGPWMVPADEIPDPQTLGLRSWVNGEVRQDSTTADMIFSVAHLIWDLSQYLVLEPGDVLNTGTPQGVALSGRFPFLKAGDIMELEVDGLGRQRQELHQA